MMGIMTHVTECVLQGYCRLLIIHRFIFCSKHWREKLVVFKDGINKYCHKILMYFQRDS